MKRVMEHVDFQLPNQSTMAHYLLDTINCSDYLLIACVANIQCDQDLKGELHDHKLAVVFLLPACTVVLCLAKREPIAENKTAGISTMTLKEGIGQTGVEFLWYPRK